MALILARVLVCGLVDGAKNKSLVEFLVAAKIMVEYGNKIHRATELAKNSISGCSHHNCMLNGAVTW